jgi:hypothetical protein
MAGLSEQSIDPKRTVVVLNFPSNVGEDELTIHFQKEKNGGGDVDDVLLDGSVAFVTFDMHEGLEYSIYIAFPFVSCTLILRLIGHCHSHCTEYSYIVRV